MRTKTLLVLLTGITVIPFIASAKPITPDQLEKLSQERQNEIGPRNWGAPLPAISLQKKIKPLPDELVCKSPLHDFESIYQQPDATSSKIGTVTSQMAVTNVVKNGYRKILYRGKQYGWVDNKTVVPFKPFVKGGPTSCIIVGENEKGMVLFTHPITKK